jgi:hypothetical protein
MKTNKSKLSKTALTLILTIALTFITLPLVSAHDPAWDIPVVAYAVARPNPIGVNQEVLILFWPNHYPITAEGAYGDRWTWTIEITDPSGNTQTIGPITSDPVGGGWTTFTPDQIGTYTIVAKFPATVLAGDNPPPGGYARGGDAYIGDTYLASDSEPVYLTVQTDAIQGWQETPLPTEYWTRPINDMNRDWYVLAGNWLAGAAQNVGPTTTFGYGLGPESAHVMWSSSVWAGGIMDERFGNTGYATYHYEGVDFQPPIILNGKLYYDVRSLPREGWRCLDLYTGEELYFRNTTGPVVGVGATFDFSGVLAGGRLDFGQIYNYESPNQHGGMPYLWSTGSTGNSFFPAYTDTWQMYDADTGSYICSIGNVSFAGTMVYGKDGSILFYNIANDRLTVWNTSRAIWYEDEFYANSYWMWRPTLNMTFDGNNGFSLNVSIPSGLPGRPITIREGEYIIGGTGGQNDELAVVEGTLWALSLEPGKEGTKLWELTFTPPKATASAAKSVRGGYPVQGPVVVPEYNVFFFREPVSLKRWGYDLSTGQLLWETDPEPALNYYGMVDNVYDGKLLTCGYGGTLIAYDIRTGVELWRYEAKNVGFESPYGNYPIGIGCIADGKIYLGAGEHSPTQPLWRGPNLRCIDANTGEEIWKIDSLGVSMPSGNGGSNYAIADGYLVALNAYDMKLYCYGKGPSATTVSVKNDVSQKGESVQITGTIVDLSAGTKQQEQAARFPNGVPAIADECQEDWMEYVYMQQALPDDIQGVTIKLYAIDPNGNYQDIGEATSDLWGNFGKSWKAPVEGEYLLIAEFEGSNSYYKSSASTYFTVDPAPSAGGPIVPEPTEPTEAPLISTEIAILLAAVIIAVAVLGGFFILRKRK